MSFSSKDFSGLFCFAGVADLHKLKIVSCLGLNLVGELQNATFIDNYLHSKSYLSRTTGLTTFENVATELLVFCRIGGRRKKLSIWALEY